MEKKMKGIKIGVIVEKQSSDSQQESASEGTQNRKGSEGIYVNDPVSHEQFVQNIFSVLKT